MNDLIARLKHFAKSGSGPINDACAQAIDEIERLQEAKRRALHVADDRSKENVTLRRTLESHAVKNRGGPFWKCEYCQAMSQTPIAFAHKPECVIAATLAPQQEAARPFGEVLDEMDHEQAGLFSGVFPPS